jgi:Raf kinase inhibitor-like YbhB/YbcL family protein
MLRHRSVWFFVAVVLFWYCGCTDKRDSMTVPSNSPTEGGPKQAQKENLGRSAMTFQLNSSAFTNGGAIPTNYGGEGADVSPPLAWDGAPAGTKEFAIVCDDPDAPSADPWVHWVIYGIAGDVRGLPEGLKSGATELKVPLAARQGKNSWPSGVTTGYRGPLPPPGSGPHHYHFKLYALDAPANLPPGATKQQVLDSIKGHVLTETELVGTYERKH